MSGLWASLKLLPVRPTIEGTQSLMGVSAWGCVRKLRPKESQIYGRQLWGSLAASQILSSNACMKYILPSTLNSNKVWLKSCSNCSLSDARYLILSSLGSFAIWSKRDLDLFQTFAVETCSMAWSHWARGKKKKKGYWRPDHLPFGRKTHDSFAWFSKLFCHKRSYPLLQRQEIPILPWNCCRVKYGDIISFCKCRAQNSCEDELSSPFLSLPLSLFYWDTSFPLCLQNWVCCKQETQNKRSKRKEAQVTYCFFLCYLESLLLLWQSNYIWSLAHDFWILSGTSDILGDPEQSLIFHKTCITLIHNSSFRRQIEGQPCQHKFLVYF